jgi:hypothetical protein
MNTDEGLNRLGETEQAIGGQVRARDVLKEGAEVDTRIPLAAVEGLEAHKRAVSIRVAHMKKSQS